MVLQNYQNLIEMTSNIFIIVAFGVGFKCPSKINLNTQWGGGYVVLTIFCANQFQEHARGWQNPHQNISHLFTVAGEGTVPTALFIGGSSVF